MRVLTIVVCVLVLTAGCVGSSGIPIVGENDSSVTDTESTPRQPITPSSDRYDVDVERIENLIHEKINERRVKNGVEPLKRNGTLDAVARYKSWDMAQQDYFAHNGPNGTTHAELRAKYGIECGNIGQNLAKDRGFVNNDSLSLSNNKIVAKRAVETIFDSPPHRQNALSSNYDSQGIGVFVDENGTVFVTQELCG